MKRYDIEAKRRDTDEEWSAWTTVNNYGRASEHVAKVEQIGYEGHIRIHPEIIEIWDILGENTLNIAEKTDAIFDADFRKASVIRKETTDKVTKKVAKKILSEISKAVEQYDNPSDMKQRILELEQEYGLKDCRKCCHFDSCECINGKVCERFEQRKRTN